MAQRVPPRAASNYKQVRLQFTEEAGGRVSASLYVKPLNVDWTQQHVVRRWNRRLAAPLETFEDVLGLMILMLEEDTLPGIG